MNPLVFVDTNVLLYSVDPDNPEKRVLASRILQRRDLALSVQVLQEFYSNAVKPSKAWRMSFEDAAAFVGQWRRFPVQDLTIAVFDSALELHRRHRYSYWDSAILAAARALGCGTVFSEDLDHGRIVEGMRIVNPFREVEMQGSAS